LALGQAVFEDAWLSLFSWGDLFFSFVVVGYFSFYDVLVSAFDWDRPFAAVGIITGITARVVRDYVIGEIFLPCVRKLMGFARSKKKRIPGPHFRDSILVPHAAAA